MTGLTIIEPTTVLRDWARTTLALPEVWAGGIPPGSLLPSMLITIVGSTLDGPICRWSTQWDADAATQPEAASLAARWAKTLVTTQPRTLIGTLDSGAQVLYGGAVESSISLFPGDAGPDDPDIYRHVLLADVLTIAIPPTD